MMRNGWRRVTAVVFTALLLGTPAAISGSAAATTAAVPAAITSAATAASVLDTTSNPLSALNGCLVARKTGDVLILLDKSGSIFNTDPKGARIDAAKALLDRLAKRITDPKSEISGAKLTTAVTTFGDAVFQGTERVDPAATKWTDLTAANLPALQSDVEALRPVHDGKETNYWAALDWVAQAEEAHSGPAVADACHLVFWFSDGAPLLAPRGDGKGWPDGVNIRTPWTASGTSPGGTQAEANKVLAGQLDDIKRPGGLADRLRTDNITLVAVGLANGIPVSRLEVMKCIAVNSGTQCGSQPGIGAFYPVTDAGQLLLAVEGLGDSSTFLPIDQKPVCAVKPCQSAHLFKLDSSLKKVHIVGVPSIAGLKVEVKSPDGTVADIAPVATGASGQPTTVNIGQIGLSYQWVSDKEITVDMVRPSDTVNWTGQWSVTFIDTTGSNPKAVAATRVSLSADLALIAQNPPATVPAGEQLAFAVALRSLSGGNPDVVTTSPPTMVGTVTLVPATTGAAAVTIATGPVADLSKNGISWSVPLNSTLGPATVQISLDVTTVTGIKLDPVVRQFDLTIGPAKGSPTVSSTFLDFGSVEGTDPASASLSVAGPGCVWVSSGPLETHPADLSTVAIGGPAASPATCVTLAENEKRDISLTATPGSAANGAVRGQVIVHLARAGHADDTAGRQAVPYSLGLRRKAAGTVKWLIFAAALLVGIGIPILVLWLTRRIAARYPTDVQLSAARIPVTVGPRGLQTHGGGAPTLPQQWNAVPPPVDGRRGLLVEGVKLRARSGRMWSAAAGYSEAVDRPGTAAVAPFYGGGNFLARLPLGVQGTWSLLFRSREDLAGPNEQVAGDLLLITHPGTDQATRRNLLGEAVSQGPGLVSDLREAVRAKSGAAGSDGSGRGPGGGAGPGPESESGPGPGAGSGPAGGAPAPGWGAQGAPASAQGTPASAQGAPANPGWGTQGSPAGWASQAPTANPQWGQGAAAAPGWGSQAPPANPGWGTPGTPPPAGWGNSAEQRPPRGSEPPPVSGWPSGSA